MKSVTIEQLETIYEYKLHEYVLKMIKDKRAQNIPEMLMGMFVFDIVSHFYTSMLEDGYETLVKNNEIYREITKFDWHQIQKKIASKVLKEYINPVPPPFNI
jgi:hypothetical protein